MSNLFALAIMFVKKIYGVVYTPLRVVMETSFHSSEEWKVSSVDSWDDFDSTGKNIFRILKNEVRYKKYS